MTLTWVPPYPHWLNLPAQDTPISAEALQPYTEIILALLGAINEVGSVPTIDDTGSAAANRVRSSQYLATQLSAKVSTPVSGDTVGAAFTKTPAGTGAYVGPTHVDAGLYLAAAGSDETTAWQAMVNAAPAGAVFHHPRKGSGYYTISAGIQPSGTGQHFIFHPGVEVRQTTWAKPIIDILDVDNVQVDGLQARFTGTRGGVGTSFRGDSGYGYGAAIWSNSSGGRFSNIRVNGHSIGIYLSGYDSGTGALNSRLRTDNRIVNLLADTVNFALLYICQDSLLVDGLIARNLVDDSSGANPIHAVYGSGTSTLLSRNVNMRGMVCQGCSTGAAFQYKYVNGLVVGDAIADNSAALAYLVDCTSYNVHDLIHQNGQGNVSTLGLGALFAVDSINGSSMGKISNIQIDATTSATTGRSVFIRSDDTTVRGVRIRTNRTAVNDDYDFVWRSGDNGVIDDLDVINNGSEGRTILVDYTGTDYANGLTIRNLRTKNSRQLVDIGRGSTNVLLDYDVAEQRSPGTNVAANNGMGGVGPIFGTAGTNEPLVKFVRRSGQVRTVTSSTTLVPLDEAIISNNSSAATHTLPRADVIPGKSIRVKSSGAGSVTIQAAAVPVSGSNTASTVDGSSTVSLTIGSEATYRSDGLNWTSAPTSGGGSGVPTSRLVASGTGLTGGGDLTADRTLAVSYGTTSGTAAQGNDTRITGAVQNTRLVSTGYGLSGGGDLTADRTHAVALTTDSGQLASDTAVTSGSLGTLFTTATLAVGTWLVTMTTTIVPTAASASNFDLEVAVGTATASFTGASSTSGRSTGSTSQPVSASLSFLATVTAAGTLVLSLKAPAAGLTAKAVSNTDAKAGATGYTAIRIA